MWFSVGMYHLLLAISTISAAQIGMTNVTTNLVVLEGLAFTLLLFWLIDVIVVPIETVQIGSQWLTLIVPLLVVLILADHWLLRFPAGYCLGLMS